MTSLSAALDRLDWTKIGAALDAESHVVLPGLLNADTVRALAQQITVPDARRVTLQSRKLGYGELFYFEPHLPKPLEQWRPLLYPYLLPIANRWNKAMGMAQLYPPTLGEFQLLNRSAGQTQPLSCLSRLDAGGHVLLHQCAEGEHTFPMQIVGVLSDPDKDFQGGELVLTEQRPRMQSRPVVVPLGRGDIAIITTAKRPVKSAAGSYLVKLRHAISHVHRGERIGFELSFHNARWRDRFARMSTLNKAFR